MQSQDGPPATTFRLDRGFRLIGPFFGALIPFALWAFFTDGSAPPNLTGGLIAIGVLAFLAVFCHITWLRTRVVVDSHGIAVRGLVGERHATWRDVVSVELEGTDLTLHLATGRPLKASTYLADHQALRRFAEARVREARGLFGSPDNSPVLPSQDPISEAQSIDWYQISHLVGWIFWGFGSWCVARGVAGFVFPLFDFQPTKGAETTLIIGIALGLVGWLLHYPLGTARLYLFGWGSVAWLGMQLTLGPLKSGNWTELSGRNWGAVLVGVMLLLLFFVRMNPKNDVPSEPSSEV